MLAADALFINEALFDGQSDSAGNQIDGLNGAHAVAPTSDGSFVYTAGYRDNALGVFRRDGANLNFVEALFDGGLDGQGNTVDGLLGVRSVTLSPDGNHVYAAGWADKAIAVFSRDTGTGKLTFVEALLDGATDGQGNLVDGLWQAHDVKVTDDGAHVYVAAVADSAVSVFARDASTGRLTFVETLFDGATDGQGNLVDGLWEARSVRISPDGKHVYVAARADDSVALFNRDVATGRLTYVEALFDGGTDSQGNFIDGLDFAISIAMSPDGGNVYVVGTNDSALAAFNRDPSTGKLTHIETLVDGQMGGMGNVVDGLLSVRSIAITHDGESLITGSSGDNAVALFGRDASTGELEFLDAAREGGKDSLGNTVDGLAALWAVAVDTNGTIYSASINDNALGVFNFALYATVDEAEAAVSALLTQVEDLGLSTGAETSLTAKLEAVLQQLDVEVPQTGGMVALMDAFIIGVNRWFDLGQIDLADRDELIAEAELIKLGIEVLIL